ncbi:MAG: urease accessory protein UreF, partial [Tidjanibacter sp.]|nr:urease accessory protein UreF [Tidjanibacter sp.]
MFPLSCCKLFALLQMGDSAFPIGGFSFSAGLEAAIAEGMVTTIEDLDDYTRTVVCAAARLDAIAALEAFRAIGQSHLSRLGEIDHRVL